MPEEVQFIEPIRVSIPGIRRENFKTVNQVRDWLNEERKRWDEFWQKITASPLYNIQGNQRNSAHQQLNNIEQHIQQYINISPENEGAKAGIADQILQLMEGYASRHLVTTAPVFSEIIDLANSDPDVATVRFLNLIDDDISINNQTKLLRITRAVVIAEQQAIDPKKAVAEQKRALTNLEKKWLSDLDDRHRDFQAALHRINQNRKRLEDQALRAIRQYDEAREGHEKRMSDMETAFSTDMKLKAAEKFWGKKRRVNRQRERRAQMQLYWSLAAALIFLGSVYWLIYQNTDPNLSAGQIFIYLAPTILAMWPLRILANNLRTNKDLADDAEEREAMVMTFKALEYEGRVSDEERLVILSALFRPHERGGEEGIPHPAWEAILQRMSGKPQ